MFALSTSVLAKSCNKVGAELRIPPRFPPKLFGLLALAEVYGLTLLGLVGDSMCATCLGSHWTWNLPYFARMWSSALRMPAPTCAPYLPLWLIAFRERECRSPSERYDTVGAMACLYIGSRRSQARHHACSVTSECHIWRWFYSGRIRGFHDFLLAWLTESLWRGYACPSLACCPYCYW